MCAITGIHYNIYRGVGIWNRVMDVNEGIVQWTLMGYAVIMFFYFITTHSIIFRGTNDCNSLKNNAQQKCHVENLGVHLS